MLTITLSIIGAIATYVAIKSGCGKLSFMAGFATVAAIAGSF
jgi:ethanolamine utilization microcompartment shell protein EutS